MGVIPLPRKGHSSPPLFGPCLLWPLSPISATAELLFIGLRFEVEQASRGLSAVAELLVNLSKAVSRKRCKIGGKLILITNRKSYYELSIGTKIGDIEWP